MSTDVAVRLQNLTDFPQRIFNDDGKMLELAPKAVELFKAPVAKLFLKQRGQYVRIYEDVVVPPIPGAHTVWIANMTGNPGVKEKVKVEVYDPEIKKSKKVEITNPLREPVLLKKRMPGDEVDEGPDDRRSLPGALVMVPAYSRLPVPEPVAVWLETRDSMQDVERRGSVMRARPPTNFEPNTTWPYHEILFYAYMVDSNEFALKKPEFTRAKSGQYGDAFEKKSEVLKRLFFYLVDDRVNLPGEDAFKAALTRYEGSKESGT